MKVDNNNLIKELNYNNKSHTQANQCFNFIVSFIFFVLIN